MLPTSPSIICSARYAVLVALEDLMNDIIMNHSSGFIIGIQRKIVKHPNRTHAKTILKTSLV